MKTFWVVVAVVVGLAVGALLLRGGPGPRPIPVGDPTRIAIEPKASQPPAPQPTPAVSAPTPSQPPAPAPTPTPQPKAPEATAQPGPTPAVDPVKPEPAPAEVKPEAVKPEDLKPQETKPEPIKPEQTKPEEIKPVEPPAPEPALSEAPKPPAEAPKAEPVETVKPESAPQAQPPVTPPAEGPTEAPAPASAVQPEVVTPPADAQAPAPTPEVKSDVPPAPGPAEAKPSDAPPSDGPPVIEQREDGSMLVDGKYEVKGDGSAERPYEVTWEMLISAQETYQPKEGKKLIPGRLAMLDNKHVKITGYIAFPLYVQEAREMLSMLNQWDGCCIGVPPTPYDAIEVRLRDAVTGPGRFATFGSVEGRFGVKPYVVGDWLVGLYTLDEAKFNAKVFSGS